MLRTTLIILGFLLFSACGNALQSVLGPTADKEEVEEQAVLEEARAEETTVGEARGGNSLGSLHSCALSDDGIVLCWGRNRYGQLGIGNRIDQKTPVPVALETERRARAIGSGHAHTCAILDDGSLKCWGSNVVGQLGVGDITGRDTPVGVNLGWGRTATEIALGAYHTCAILDDGSLKCWGAVGAHQLGREERRLQSTPIPVNLGEGRSAVAIELGAGHTCAILDDDSLLCWGWNHAGQVGDGGVGISSAPVTIDLGRDRSARVIALGGNHTCAILDDGSLKCWGDNSDGQLGDGTHTRRHAPVAIDLGEDRTAVGLGLGDAHTCAILDDGAVKCWGQNDFAQLGIGHTDGHNTPVVVDLGNGREAVAIHSGGRHNCVVLSDDTLVCWGGNSYGQLGVALSGPIGDDPGEMGENLPWVDLARPSGP